MVWRSAVTTVLAATFHRAIAENFPEDDGWGLLWERGMQYNFVPCQGRRCEFVEVWHADGTRASFEPFRNFTCGSNVSSISVSFGDDAGEGDTQLLVDCGEEVQVIAGALMPGALIPPPDTRILPGCLEAKVNDSRQGVVASALTSGASSSQLLASSSASQSSISNSGAEGRLSQTTSGTSSRIDSLSSSAATEPSADGALTDTSLDSSSASEELPSGPSVGPSSGGGTSSSDPRTTSDGDGNLSASATSSSGQQESVGMTSTSQEPIGSSQPSATSARDSSIPAPAAGITQGSSSVPLTAIPAQGGNISTTSCICTC
ncbi:hypothetical protein KC333_g9092 [Hortaea werneckii]|nr:hypothetical protein KC349_g9158 [Hortaea werneckii]KAI7208560.1 hypothetical protein KC333_g9092 [Hortaea werneckii]KAI7301912.1 hypothetical protein KC326_g9096 [Hortaea werneckii]